MAMLVWEMMENALKLKSHAVPLAPSCGRKHNSLRECKAAATLKHPISWRHKPGPVHAQIVPHAYRLT
eukprot:481284-Pleurochrysis_carterae.AAC.1